jgi:hypothetical protein
LAEERGEVTLRTAPGRILLPLDWMPELKELFHGFDQNDQAGLDHTSVAVRAYAAAHLLQDEPRKLARLKPLLADDAPVRVSAKVGGQLREVELRTLVVEMLCAVAQGDEPGVATDAARQLLLRARRDPKLLAIRDAVRGCLGEEAGATSGIRVALGDWTAAAVTGVRRWWSPTIP